jgi:hypothetical protein
MFFATIRLGKLVNTSKETTFRAKRGLGISWLGSLWLGVGMNVNVSVVCLSYTIRGEQICHELARRNGPAILVHSWVDRGELSRTCQDNAKDATAMRISCEIVLLRHTISMIRVSVHSPLRFFLVSERVPHTSDDKIGYRRSLLSNLTTLWFFFCTEVPGVSFVSGSK